MSNPFNPPATNPEFANYSSSEEEDFNLVDFVENSSVTEFPLADDVAANVNAAPSSSRSSKRIQSRKSVEHAPITAAAASANDNVIRRSTYDGFDMAEATTSGKNDGGAQHARHSNTAGASRRSRNAHDRSRSSMRTVDSDGDYALALQMQQDEDARRAAEALGGVGPAPRIVDDKDGGGRGSGNGGGGGGGSGGASRVNFVRHRRIFIPLISVFDILYFAIMMLTSWPPASPRDNPMLGPDADVLLSFGAQRTNLILNGQWYRLLTPIVVHVGVIHLAMNMFFQIYTGLSCEIWHGALKTATIYIGSGVFGNIVSAIFLPGIVSAGASSGLFAFYAMMIIDIVQNWSILPPERARNLASLLCWTVVVLVLGALLPGINNFAHLGGLYMGFLLGTVLQSRVSMQPSAAKRVATIVAAALALASYAIALSVLYSAKPGSEWCSWCTELNCLSFTGICDSLNAANTMDEMA